MDFARQIRDVVGLGSARAARRRLRAIGTQAPIRAVRSAIPRVSDLSVRSPLVSRASRIPNSLWLALVGVIGSVLAFFALRSTGLIGGKRKVEDVMIRDVVSLAPNATLLDAAQTMRDANVGVLPIVAAGVLRGVITDRDLVVRAMARGIDPISAKVGDFATTDLVCARCGTDVDEAMQVMAHQQIGRLPVVDDGNQLIGMLTLSSLALRSTDGDEALDTAKEVSRRSARVA